MQVPAGMNEASSPLNMVDSTDGVSATVNTTAKNAEEENQPKSTRFTNQFIAENQEPVYRDWVMVKRGNRRNQISNQTKEPKVSKGKVVMNNHGKQNKSHANRDTIPPMQRTCV